MATSDARAQSGAPMDLYMRALRQLYTPFPTAATLANQSGEYGDVAAELGPKRLLFEKPNAAPIQIVGCTGNAARADPECDQLFFWYMGYSPGFSQIQPRAYFAYLTADI